MPRRTDPPEARLRRFGQRVRQLREQHELTREKLAELSGLSPRALTYLEHGRSAPTVVTVFAIADALGVAPARLFEDSPPHLPAAGDPPARLPSGSADR